MNTVVIGQLVQAERYINFAEVQLFRANTQISPSLLNFTFSSTYPGYPAWLCNNGILNDICNSGAGDTNPTLVIRSPVAFDRVKIYNRNDSCGPRIDNATITLNLIGQAPVSRRFPSVTKSIYTFVIYVPSSQPSRQPSKQPSTQPSKQPSSQPSIQPSAQPLKKPTFKPSCLPSVQPTMQPSKQPSFQPSIQPSSQPSIQPFSKPSIQPTIQPLKKPTSKPSSQPSFQPTNQPTFETTELPT